MPAAGVVTIVAVLLIVVALLVYLIPTILTLRQITAGLDEAIAGVGGLIEKTEPVNGVVETINGQLDAAVDALEGLLVKKAGLSDAMGLLEGLYPGAAAEGLRNFPDSQTTPAPRISEVYTKGTLTLARLGREAPVAAVSPEGPVLRDVAYGSLNARLLYPNTRQSRPGILPKSPVIRTRRFSTRRATRPEYDGGCRPALPRQHPRELPGRLHPRRRPHPRRRLRRRRQPQPALSPSPRGAPDADTGTL
jgi:hypothetical protein